MPMAKNDFSEMFRGLRARLGLTQNEMADAIGISLRFYASLETGKSEPSFSTILKMKKGLNLSVAEIIGETEPNTDHAEWVEMLRTLFSLASGMTDKQLGLLIEFAHSINDNKSPPESARGQHEFSEKKKRHR